VPRSRATTAAEGRPTRATRSLGLLLALAAPVSLAASAEPPELRVELVCPRRPTAGRVVCEVELEVETGVLAWGDALVLEAPEFASPLRARVGSSAAVMKTEQRQRLQLALAATQPGTGTLRIRARAVLCSDGTQNDCRPAQREASTTVRVGPITD
jgi:uncharacterized protein (DUF58 family)